MPRKQRTKIEGSDPNYHSDLPRKPIAEPTPAIKPAPEKAAPAAATPKEAPKPRKQRQPAAKPKPAVAKTQTDARPEPETKPTKPTPQNAATREIHLTAAVKRDHGDLIAKLADKGIDPKVPVRLAGRKAVQLFEPKREFIEKPEADRLPLRDGYQTTKRVDAELIDHLRAENDPYGLSSDTAMLRGQFEPLFWKCLDEVLEELSSK